MIRERLKDSLPSISFEFFPPKSDQGEKDLFETIQRLIPLKPTFVSVTYGAGGSTREKTHNIVKRIKQETPLEPMAHFTCIGHSKAELRQIIEGYSAAGIENILALRGDPPQGQTEFRSHPDGLSYADELVTLVRSLGDFSIGVAAFPERHPESPNWEHDINYFRHKVDAGADFAITQMFFDNRYFFEYLERVKKTGITVPIIPGIMPITNFKQIKRFSELCGATIPEWLVKKMEPLQENNEEVAKVGVEFAIRQCQELLDSDAKGLHFYTLNKSSATVEIYKNLSLPTKNLDFLNNLN